MPKSASVRCDVVIPNINSTTAMRPGVEPTRCHKRSHRMKPIVMAAQNGCRQDCHGSTCQKWLLWLHKDVVAHPVLGCVSLSFVWFVLYFLIKSHFENVFDGFIFFCKHHVVFLVTHSLVLDCFQVRGLRTIPIRYASGRAKWQIHELMWRKWLQLMCHIYLTYKGTLIRI